MVNILTLPTNMVRINMNLLAEDSSDVIPLLSPTVLKAEMHSKQISRNPFPESKKLINRIETEITRIDKTIIAKALLTETCGISLL